MSDLDVYESLLKRSLERGVPADAVAEIFELPPDIVKEMAKEVQIRRFNTADKNEYLEYLEWATLEKVMEMIRTGSPDQVARLSTAILGKQIAAAGKRPSSATEESRQFLLEAFSHVRESAPAEMRPGRFVMGNTSTERRAHSEEDEDDEAG